MSEEKTNALVPVKEVLSMVTYDDDVFFGRMPEGGDLDPSEWDMLPQRHVQIDPSDDGLMDDVFAGDDEAPPEPFSPATEEKFPVFKSALRRYQAAESKPRVARVDTEETYSDLVCDSAVRELDRRVRELRGVIEQHLADHHGPTTNVLRKWDVIAGAEAVQDLKRAKSPEEAVEAMPKVPVDLPEYARGKVQCWRDGDSVVCSVHFEAADGSHRIATMAARPNVDVNEVAGCAMRAGVDPITILGAVDDLAEIACGKKLVKDTAAAALQASQRSDVSEMDEPLLLTSRGSSGSAPVAALAYLQEQCDAGDPQAEREMSVIQEAAMSPQGRRVAGPLLEEVGRVVAARRQRALPAHHDKPTLMQKYAKNAGWTL